MVGQLPFWSAKPAYPEEHNQKTLPVNDRRNILITSALPYVNNVPHLGNIIGCVLSGDVFARYSRMRGHQTLYICGTDEYGTATETKALQEGLTPKQVCDKYHAIHKEIYEWFNIDFDKFGRTSTPEQTELCQDIFSKLQKNGFTTIKSIDQLHCESCNKFLADRYVNGICPYCGFNDARGDQCDDCGKLYNAIELKSPRCHICKNEPRIKQSEHVFLLLDELQSEVAAYIEKQLAVPNNRWSPNAVSIVRGWIKGGLEKRCITRDLEWGVPVPLEELKNKVFYVWYDAPIGYLSITKALLGDDWTKWWKNSENVELYQFIGKDNVAFHGVMFPCTQLGTRDNFTIVNNLCATEYLNYEDRKFSKSRGTGVFGDAAKETGIDADVWRFYLLYMRPESQDTTFSWDDFSLKVNSELLANLGNFVNRALSFIANNYGGHIQEMHLQESDIELLKGIESDLKEWDQLMDEVKLKDAVRTVLSLSRRGNQYMQTNAPWALLKGTEDEKKRAGTVISVAANVAYILALVLHPIMPKVSERIREQCGSQKLPAFQPEVICYLKAGHKIGQPKPLFEKIEKAKIDQLKARFAGADSEDKTAKKDAKNKKPAKGSENKTGKQSGKSLHETRAVNGTVDKMSLATRNFPKLAQNQQLIDQLFNANKARFEQARQLFVTQKLAELKKSNASLEKEIAELKEKLVKAEVAGGVKQISVPKPELSSTSPQNDKPKETNANAASVSQKQSESKAQPSEKKQKKATTAGDKGAAASDETIDIGRLDLRVGRIIHCEKHPNADSLYLEKIDVGEPEPRTVVSGLVKHVPLDQMQNRLVVVLCNLKPAKMRGVESKAMVMCASSPEKVEIMEVDPNSKPGTTVVCPPFAHRPDAQLNPKKMVWETVAQDLLVSPEGIATWKGHPLLVDGKTHMVAPTLKNVHVK